MNKTIILFWALLLFLFIAIIHWGDYLIKNGYIVEQFSNYDSNTNIWGSYSKVQRVNMPLTTTKTCKNMCGPNNRCSLTGEQCSIDVECYGCNPLHNRRRFSHNTEEVRGQNDAGKLTTEKTPTYSSLTTDIGTQAKLINKPETPPPEYFKGVNTWANSFNAGMDLYNKRYTPTWNRMAARYPERTTLSGEFYDNGPLAANDFL